MVILLDTWLGLAGAAMAGAAEEGPLKVRVEAERGPFFVGQAIEVRVGVVGDRERPRVDDPEIEGADVWKIDARLRPIAASGIGGASSELNLFVTRYCVVPRRPGDLRFPAVLARLGSRTGRGRSFPITVRPVPLTGRTAAFLGGVGEFKLEAVVEPHAVRVGETIEYRLTVRGPAAWGTTDAPDLKRFDQLPLGFQELERSSDLALNPPARTFAYRFRPMRPGEDVLPPVSISTFDPRTMSYVTRAAPGLPIRVVSAPSLKPSDVDLAGALARSEGPGSKRSAWAVLLFAGLALLTAAIGLFWTRLSARERRSGPATARKVARRLARHFGPDAARQSRGLGLNDPAAIARAVQAGLVAYLEAGVDRPPGALTPDEALEGTAACTGAEELARQAALIAARCDEVLYRHADTSPNDGALRDDARALFNALGRARRSRTLDEKSHRPA